MTARGSKIEVVCEREGCGVKFMARTADRARGWGRFCSKACSKGAPAHQKEDPMTGPHPDPLDPMQNMEPPAVAAGVLVGGIAAHELVLVASISTAISLKRIADAMTGGEGSLNAYFFEQAAYQAGVAFERGRR